VDFVNQRFQPALGHGRNSAGPLTNDVPLPPRGLPSISPALNIFFRADKSGQLRTGLGRVAILFLYCDYLRHFCDIRTPI
jgi:hypothetical protein